MTVSVIVRAFDRRQYLEEALTSIRLQSYKDIEAVIVQDGSLDLGLNFTELLGQVPFKHILLGEMSGRVHAANVGIDNASGDMICFLDDDDIFYPYHVETLVTALHENPSYQVVYSDALKAKQTTWGNHYITNDFSLDHSKDYNYAALKKDNYIPILCALFKKSVLRDQIRMDANIEVLEDWDFWLQIARREPFFHLPKITCEYRSRDDKTNTTGQVEHLWSYSREYLKQKHG